MAKSASTYWNTLAAENRGQWTPCKGLEGIAEELTLSIDVESGEYTRLTRFLPGADRFGRHGPNITPKYAYGRKTRDDVDNCVGRGMQHGIPLTLLWQQRRGAG